MVSDIRKQYRLNEEVLALRKQLSEVYDDIQKGKTENFQKEILEHKVKEHALK